MLGEVIHPGLYSLEPGSGVAQRSPDKASPPAPQKVAEKADPAAATRKGADKAAAGTAQKPAEKADGQATARKDARAADAPVAAAPLGESATAGARYTVQIAAYSGRAAAEALRSTISASGHDAYIVETDGPPGAPRYRVRVGSYPSREAAVAAASRLPVPGERFVTTR